MIKIILVDDHHLVRNSLSTLLQKHPHIEVVADAADGSSVLELLKEGLQADVLITDLLMPGMGGMELLQVLTAQQSAIKVIFLSMMEDEKSAAMAFSSGASAYLSKSIDSDELLFCLQHVMKGNQYVSSELAISVLEKYQAKSNLPALLSNQKVHFTAREIQLFELVAEGKTNQEIADQLYLSRRTVESNRQNLIDKSGVKNTAALIRYAVLNGLIN